MNGLLLDTHYWLWYQMGDTQRVGPGVQQEFSEAQMAGKLCASSISVLELARLVHAGRIDLADSMEGFMRHAESADGFSILPLSHQILIESVRLPGTIHRDPSDRLLVATARHYGLTLVTRDKELLDYAKQGHLNARKL